MQLDLCKKGASADTEYFMDLKDEDFLYTKELEPRTTAHLTAKMVRTTYFFKEKALLVVLCDETVHEMLAEKNASLCLKDGLLCALSIENRPSLGHIKGSICLAR